SGSSGNPIQNIPLNQAELFLAKNETTMSIEQTSTMLGRVNSSGGLLDVQGQTIQQTGSVASSASADNDPDTVNNVSNTGSLTQSGAAISYSAGSGANSLTLTPSNGDTGSSMATVQ